MYKSLPPRGAWIEIQKLEMVRLLGDCRSPHGERGLKSLLLSNIKLAQWSLPPRGAWIEIIQAKNALKKEGRSPHGERGLKLRSQNPVPKLSLVAPPTGSVD